MFRKQGAHVGAEKLVKDLICKQDKPGQETSES